MLAAEELLPWDALRPSWGGRRYDWLGRLHGAAEAAQLAMPLHELDAELRGWADSAAGRGRREAKSRGGARASRGNPRARCGPGSPGRSDTLTCG